jgi:hypothetical protein
MSRMKNAYKYSVSYQGAFPEMREMGGSIITTKNGKPVVRKGEPGPWVHATGDPSYPYENFPKPQLGEIWVGTYHSHPTNVLEKNIVENLDDMTISLPDIHLFLFKGMGKELYVRSENCIFILTLGDLDKDKFDLEKLEKRYEDCENQNKGKPKQEVAELALLAAIKGTGMCYYKVCKGKERANSKYCKPC